MRFLPAVLRSMLEDSAVSRRYATESSALGERWRMPAISGYSSSICTDGHYDLLDVDPRHPLVYLGSYLSYKNWYILRYLFLPMKSLSLINIYLVFYVWWLIRVVLHLIAMGWLASGYWQFFRIQRHPHFRHFTAKLKTVRQLTLRPKKAPTVT